MSRRATIQRHLLPVMLAWFADGADPDAGLLAFRRISDALGTTHWYLSMLRDEGTAAQRLARVLSSSRYAVDLLIRSPETVSLLGDEAGLVPPDREAVVARMRAAGGIVVAKTATPELGYGSQTYNPLHGVTVNP